MDNEMQQNNLEWYKELQYQDVKVYIRDNINSASRSFVAIGYYLKYVRDNQLFKEDEYSGISEFAKAEFGISPAQASKFMSINDRFSVDGNSPILLEQYKDFSSSKLSEMLYLTDEQLDQVSITTTKAEIRQIGKPVKEEIETVSFSPAKTESRCFIKKDLEDGLVCSGGISDKCNTCDRFEPEEQEPEPITIDDLDLSIRTYNCLKRAGIDTVDELRGLTRDDLISVRSMSNKILDEINEKLSEVGRCLKMNDTPKIVNDEPEIVDNEPEIVNDVDEEVIDEPSFEIVKADIIKTEYEDDNDDDDEPGITDPEHYTYRDVYDELDKLMEYVENFREDNSIVPGRRKAKMRLDAIILLDKEMKLSVEDNKLEPEQPELPILRNNDQRKEFIDAYETWPVWIDIKETGERYHRYDLTDKVAIVVKVSFKHSWQGYKESEDYEYGAEQYYLLGIKSEWSQNGSSMVEDETRTFYECNTNKSTLVEYLKQFQRK